MSAAVPPYPPLARGPARSTTQRVVPSERRMRYSAVYDTRAA
jgi:hypothetical protein